MVIFYVLGVLVIPNLLLSYNGYKFCIESVGLVLHMKYGYKKGLDILGYHVFNSLTNVKYVNIDMLNETLNLFQGKPWKGLLSACSEEVTLVDCV